MDVVAMALAAVLYALTILFVARPFLRREARGAGMSLAPEMHTQEIIGLLEERDRALAAMQELDFDLQVGTISLADHRRLIGPLRNDAANALRQLGKVPEYQRAAHETTPENSRFTDRLRTSMRDGPTAREDGTSDVVTSAARSARRVL